MAACPLSFGDSRWASVKASGSLRLASRGDPAAGEVRFSAERLADLDPADRTLGWAGSSPGLAGRLSAHLTLTDAGVGLIEAEGDGLRLPGPVEIGTLALSARVTEPLGTAQTQATLRLGGLALGEVGGDLSLTAQGPAAALDLTADAGLTAPTGPVKLDGGRAPGRPRPTPGAPASGGPGARRDPEPAGPGGPGLRRRPRGGPPAPGAAQGGDRDRRTDRAAARPHRDPRRPAPGPGAAGRAADLPLTGTLGADLRLTGTLDAPVGSLAPRRAACA